MKGHDISTDGPAPAAGDDEKHAQPIACDELDYAQCATAANTAGSASSRPKENQPR